MWCSNPRVERLSAAQRLSFKDWRTLVVRIFPNAAAWLPLVRALGAEIHKSWIEAMQYLNMEPLRENKKEALRQLGEAA